MSKKKKNRYAFDPDYAVPPGETLIETLNSVGMKQRDLALRTGLSAKTINEIIKGKAPITPDTALRLERVTGIPARLWNNLETNYREQLAKIADMKRLEADLDWLGKIPTKELIRRKVIEKPLDKVSLLHAVLRFFGVSSPERWNELWMPPTGTGAFRKSARFRAEPGAVATWLRLGELEAQKIRTERFDAAGFRTALGEVRKLTTELPRVFVEQTVELCEAVGVAVVFVPEINKCPTSGVARWLTPTKALIQLSLRYKSDDQLWFSFFHEAGHILNDRKKEVYIDDGDGDVDDDREARANRFAANFMIPPEHTSVLPMLKTRSAIVAFAERISIAPGIVVGRLQKEGHLSWRTPLNKLKRPLRWTET